MTTRVCMYIQIDEGYGPGHKTNITVLGLDYGLHWATHLSHNPTKTNPLFPTSYTICRNDHLLITYQDLLYIGSINFSQCSNMNVYLLQRMKILTLQKSLMITPRRTFVNDSKTKQWSSRFTCLFTNYTSQL